MLPTAAEWAAAERRSERTAQAWFAGAPVARLRAAFADLDPQDVDAVAEAARAVLHDADWITPLLAPLIDALSDDPWFEPPLRVTRDRLRTTVELLELPAGVLGATVFNGAALARPSPETTLVSSGRLVVARYAVTNGALLHRWHAGDADARFCAATAPTLTALPPLTLHDGDVVTIDGRTRAHLIEGAGGEVVALTFATRTTGLVREYARESGRLLRVAATDQDQSRTRLLLTLLRHEGRRDAIDCFEAATHAPAFHLRWAAMREWLALDATSALPRLRSLAATDPHPEVSAVACATLPLVEARLCPA